MKYLSLLSLLLSFNLFAEQDSYFQVGRVELKELPVQNELVTEEEISLGDILLKINDLVAIGQKVVDLVQGGKPVINTNFPTVSVLPNHSSDPSNYAHVLGSSSGWSDPTVRKYSLEVDNKLGVQVVSFEFIVVFQHSGEYEGKGKYLTGIKVIPQHINVSWGFNFDSVSELISITNIGTSEDPVATATFNIGYKLSSFANTIDGNVTFYMTGRGKIQKL